MGKAGPEAQPEPAARTPRQIGTSAPRDPGPDRARHSRSRLRWLASAQWYLDVGAQPAEYESRRRGRRGRCQAHLASHLEWPSAGSAAVMVVVGSYVIVELESVQAHRSQ